MGNYMELSNEDGYRYRDVWRKHKDLLKLKCVYPVAYKVDLNKRPEYTFNFNPTIDELANGFFAIGFRLPYNKNLFKSYIARPMGVKLLNILKIDLQKSLEIPYLKVIKVAKYIQDHFVSMYCEPDNPKEMIIIVEP